LAMDILFLRSVKNTFSKNDFSVCMNTTYADRVLGHLTDKGNYCSACGKKCIHCRDRYELDFSEKIVAVLEFPAVLPVLIEAPEDFLPDQVPKHDVLIAVAVNEEILISFIQRFPICSGIIIPIEESHWISPNAIVQITDLCAKSGIEVSFPKPFCSFDPSEGTVLHEFKETFRIGRPRIEFVFENGLIAEATVRCSAPCGATYYTARWLKGARAGKNLTFLLEKLLSSYPCTAGRMVDSEFGDSITHQASKIQQQLIDSTLSEL